MIIHEAARHVGLGVGLKSDDLEFKFRCNHYLDLFQEIRGSAPPCAST